MIELTTDQIQGLQRIELEMLIEIDRICRKCGINYTLIGGTLLGAVRNKGFIPWDDDADVAMLRSEYEKLVIAFETELDTSRFYFQDIDQTEGYRWGYGKLRRKNTVFLREHQEHMPYEQGIFVDIFPQDNVPDGKIARIIQDIKCFIVRKVLWAEVGKLGVESVYKKEIYRCLSRIPERYIKGKYHKLVNSKHNSSELVRTLTFPTPSKKYGYKREWIISTDNILFEGYTFRGVKDYDGWLRWEFGDDYMQEPPVEKRKCHPVTEIKLLC